MKAEISLFSNPIPKASAVSLRWVTRKIDDDNHNHNRKNDETDGYDESSM